VIETAIPPGVDSFAQSADTAPYVSPGFGDFGTGMRVVGVGCESSDWKGFCGVNRILEIASGD